MEMKGDGPVVLVVDDEPETRKFVGMNLTARGYRPLLAEDGTEALKLFGERPVDIVLLDLSMPGPNGVEVCRAIRRESDVPIVVLSGRSRENDKVIALDQGADDYMTKPFGVAELIARLGAALRRSQAPLISTESSFRFGDVEVDIAGHRVLKNGEATPLTATEFRLLSLLLRSRDRVLTHRYILQCVWGNSFAEDREYLRAYMYRLRKKIEDDPARPRFILNVPGVGYRFVDGEEDVRMAAAD
jgi:two-component system KDP operon response regulator KdpE